MTYILWLLFGLILGAVLLFYAHSNTKDQERNILSLGLIIAAAIYIIFVFVWGNVMWLFIELAGVVIYGLFAWFGIRLSHYWLAVGWGLHPIWDWGLHFQGPGHTVAPEWYVITCISFDLLVAGYILFAGKELDKT